MYLDVDMGMLELESDFNFEQVGVVWDLGYLLYLPDYTVYV